MTTKICSQNNIKGLVAIANKDNTTKIKLCSLCTNTSSQDVLDRIREESNLTPLKAYSIALEMGFGCQDCLVVSDGEKIYGNSLIPIEQHFDKPHTHPSWEYQQPIDRKVYEQRRDHKGENHPYYKGGRTESVGARVSIETKNGISILKKEVGLSVADILEDAVYKKLTLYSLTNC